jgi:uncharacterized protein YukE
VSDPTTFADLLEQFNEKYVQFQEDYWEAVNKIANMLNDGLSSFGKFLSDINPFDGNVLSKAIDKWNAEIFPALVKGMEDIVEKVQQAINDLAGNPGKLQIYAENYVTAQAMIFKQRNDAEIASDIDAAWGGDAARKYATVATVQVSNLEKLGEALEEGGKLTSAAALKILELWRKLIYEFASSYTDILEILASATDASKVISFEVPTALEAAAKVWQKVVDIGDILLEFFTNQATVDTINWLALQGTSGGLAGNEWPSISEGASDTINDPGAWAVK